MFVSKCVKNVTYGLLILTGISGTDVHCFSYADYVTNSLPYITALALVTANYYRRSSTPLNKSYDALSYAAPVVAAGAGSLLAQPENWQGAFLRTLPVMMGALAALALEKATAQTQLSSFKESPANMRGRFFSQKDDFYKINKQYELAEKNIKDVINSIFKENNGQLVANLVSSYNQLLEIYKQLEAKYALLHSLADQISKNSKDEQSQDLSSLTVDALTAVQKIMDNTDPALTVAKSFYFNAIINKHYMLLKQKTIDSAFVRTLINDVIDIHQFFADYSITLPYETVSLQQKVLSDLTEWLTNFKKFDQEVDRSVNYFLELLYVSNNYLKHNKMDDFETKIAQIKRYYTDIIMVYNNYQQAIENMTIRVGHMIKEYPERDILNIYQNMIDMVQIPWQGYIIALLQNHYITRKKGKTQYHTYADVINQAHKDNFITKEQYKQLQQFVANIQPKTPLEEGIVYWWKIMAAVDQEDTPKKRVTFQQKNSQI